MARHSYEVILRKDSAYPICIQIEDHKDGRITLFNLSMEQAGDLSKILEKGSNSSSVFKFTSQQKSHCRTCWIPYDFFRLHFKHITPDVRYNTINLDGKIARNLSCDVIRSIHELQAFGKGPNIVDVNNGMHPSIKAMLDKGTITLPEAIEKMRKFDKSFDFFIHPDALKEIQSWDDSLAGAKRRTDDNLRHVFT